MIKFNTNQIHHELVPMGFAVWAVYTPGAYSSSVLKALHARAPSKRRPELHRVPPKVMRMKIPLNWNLTMVQLNQTQRRPLGNCGRQDNLDVEWNEIIWSNCFHGYLRERKRLKNGQCDY